MDELTQDDKMILELHEKSSRFRRNAPDKNNIPAVFKKINAKKISLPKDFEKSKLNVEDAITRRVSWREFKGSMDLKEVSKVLYYSKGFKGLADSEFGIVQRTNAPSAGSRHSIEIYLVLQRVNGIEDGIYHYDNENHALETITEEKFSDKELELLYYGKKNLFRANMLIFMTAIYTRSSWKYGSRAYRFINLEAGHICQNIYLISEAMGLGCCAIGSWNDEALSNLIKIDPRKEIAVYSAAVGCKG